MLLVAGAGVASILGPLACGSPRVYGSYCDPCGTIPVDAGTPDAGPDAGEPNSSDAGSDAGGPFGIIVRPDAGDGG